jgi:hypothetical protein
MAKPEWLREVEREDDKLRGERAYDDYVAHRRDDDSVVRKSDDVDDVTTTRSEPAPDPAPPFTDAQSEVLAEVIANLKDEIEDLRRTVRAGDVASLHGKIDAMLSLFGGPKENGKSADKVIDILPNWRRRA